MREGCPSLMLEPGDFEGQGVQESSFAVLTVMVVVWKMLMMVSPCPSRERTSWDRCTWLKWILFFTLVAVFHHVDCCLRVTVLIVEHKWVGQSYKRQLKLHIK